MDESEERTFGEIEEERAEAVRKAVRTLHMTFDTVQVFASNSDSEYTSCHDQGAGHWYARLGQVGEWVAMQDEKARAKARRDFRRESDDDGGED